MISRRAQARSVVPTVDEGWWESILADDAQGLRLNGPHAPSRTRSGHPAGGRDHEYPIRRGVCRLDPGVQGLIHAAEMALGDAPSIREILREGQSVQVRLIHIDAARQRMGLSLKLHS